MLLAFIRLMDIVSMILVVYKLMSTWDVPTARKYIEMVDAWRLVFWIQLCTAIGYGIFHRWYDMVGSMLVSAIASWQIYEVQKKYLAFMERVRRGLS